MAGARKAAAALTRAKVLEAAISCFQSAGYEGATIRDIAKAAKVSTGAMFAHWPDKAALYREIHGHAPVTAEHGRALLLAARQAITTPGSSDALSAVIAQVEEA